MTRPIHIAGRAIGDGQPTYFVADIGANHDGNLARAKDLIHLAAAAGADAAKFQHFSAPTIVSDRGFRALAPMSHQRAWDKSVYQTYVDASIDTDWTPQLRDTCAAAGISFFTAPYSLDLADCVDPFVPAFKIGSGDITWIEEIEHVARKGKPVMLATGASTIDEVCAAVDVVLRENDELVLMQCNTNYTGDAANLRHVNLNVLRTYQTLYPHVVLGLSDHTPGHVAVLGAVALGARVVEKHFTDETARKGPDHGFSLDPSAWREMVLRTRELEDALGSPVKRVEPNEIETVVAQRRAVCAARSLPAGTVLVRSDLTALRPCPPDAIAPNRLPSVVGRTLTRELEAGDHIRWIDIA